MAAIASLAGTVVVSLGGSAAASAEFTVPVEATLGDRAGFTVRADLSVDVRPAIADALRRLADEVDPYLATGGAA